MEPLDYSQIADAVNRSGFGNQNRSRRELMRLGSDDPDAFYAKYKDFIKEPQQTQQQPYTQQPQPLYSFFDYNNPEQGYRTEDIGKGQYNLYDKNNTNLGVGYKSLQDSIREIQSDFIKNNDPNLYEYPQAPKEADKENPLGILDSGDYTVPPPSNPKDVYNPFLSNLPTEYKGNLDQAGSLSEWEVLGNLLQGRPLTAINAGSWKDSRGYPGDSISGDLIKGLNTLYGSTPVLRDGQLSGYKLNLAPAKETDYGYVDPVSVRKTDNSGSTRSDAYLQREIQDLDTWKTLAQRMTNDPKDYNVFVDKKNAESLPGWKNNEGYQYKHQSKGLGVLGDIASLALSFTPFAPLGAAIGGLNSLAKTGTGFGALGAGLGLSGAFNSLGNIFNVSPQIGSTIGKGLFSAGSQAIQNQPINAGSIVRQGALNLGLNSIFNTQRGNK